MLGGKALVHCMKGVSRSVSICAAYLMRYKELVRHCNNEFGADEVVSYIRERRPFVKPNKGFIAQLLQYEKHLDSGRSEDECEDGRRLWDEETRVQAEALQSIERMTNLLQLQL